MEKLHQWLTAQLEEKKVEPNSGLGGAIHYLLNHWQRLTPPRLKSLNIGMPLRLLRPWLTIYFRSFLSFCAWPPGATGAISVARAPK